MVMVNLEIDLADVGGRPVTMARAVNVYAPKQRGSAVTQDRVTLTDPVYVDLVAGKGTVAVEPGPLVVQIRGGMTDVKPKTVVVPDDGRTEISLREVLDSAFVYDPPVVTAAQQAAARAEAAAVRAEEAAAGGGGGGGQSLVPDPNDPDTFIVTAGGGLDADPSDPDTFVLS
ncbi:hypothetical protein ACJEDT_13155 [Rhodococcoides fascians]|uniref:hypothetical protein n=1 Tax=Rhodococcoides fascians TaxID=1828 RepID=UPI00389A3B8E